MSVKFGTCSWNYDSWVGLVYKERKSRAVEYLAEYARTYSTVEIDSWYYRIPLSEEASAYWGMVPADFLFTIKAPQYLTLTHLRESTGRQNQNFLSPQLFRQFLIAIQPILPNTSAIILQFEYLNRQKMADVHAFLEKLAKFFDIAGNEAPLAVEIRNPNYLTTDYFSLLKKHNIIHVLNEKQYMPPITEVARRYHTYFNDKIIVRLLGGSRSDIEKITKKRWDRIVQPQSNLEKIARMIQYFSEQEKEIFVNVNNHYEGSAPLSIKRLEKLIQDA